MDETNPLMLHEQDITGTWCLLGPVLLCNENYNEVERQCQHLNPDLSCLLLLHQFHERFLAYHHYCWEEENNLEFTRKQMESNPHFLAFVQVKQQQYL